MSQSQRATGPSHPAGYHHPTTRNPKGPTRAPVAQERASKPPTVPEWRLQIAVCDLLKRAYPDLLWFSVPNGGFIAEAKTVAKLKATGLRPGVPDLCFVLPGGIASFIELKSDTGRVTPEQKEFMALALRRGAPSAVCRSVDDVIRTLRVWGVESRLVA